MSTDVHRRLPKHHLGPTRAKAEQRRAEVFAEIERHPTMPSRFTRATTVAELADWWLDSVARHRVKAPTIDSYRKFVAYFVDDFGATAVVDVGAETLTAWQSSLLDRFAPFTVLNCRKVCRQVFPEAVKVPAVRPRRSFHRRIPV